MHSNSASLATSSWSDVTERIMFYSLRSLDMDIRSRRTSKAPNGFVWWLSVPDFTALGLKTTWKSSEVIDASHTLDTAAKVDGVMVDYAVEIPMLLSLTARGCGSERAALLLLRGIPIDDIKAAMDNDVDDALMDSLVD